MTLAHQADQWVVISLSQIRIANYYSATWARALILQAHTFSFSVVSHGDVDYIIKCHDYP